MLGYKEFLEEKYVNLIGGSSKEERLKYADEVFSLLQKSYASIGGIKGSGFKSVEDMVANIPFWKLSKKGGKLVAGAMYKDNGGRKRVAVFTDGTEEGKRALAAIYKEEFDRAYFEVSDGALGFIIKNVGIDFVKKYAVSPERAAELLGDEVRVPPETDPHFSKVPQLKGFFYQRELAGSWKTKVMLGTSGKKIVKIEN